MLQGPTIFKVLHNFSDSSSKYLFLIILPFTEIPALIPSLLRTIVPNELLLSSEQSDELSLSSSSLLFSSSVFDERDEHVEFVRFVLLFFLDHSIYLILHAKFVH